MIEDFIELHGPCYQFECHRCNTVSDVYDTRKECYFFAEAHDCFGILGRATEAISQILFDTAIPREDWEAVIRLGIQEYGASHD